MAIFFIAFIESCANQGHKISGKKDENNDPMNESNVDGNSTGVFEFSNLFVIFSNDLEVKNKTDETLDSTKLDINTTTSSITNKSTNVIDENEQPAEIPLHFH